MGILEEIKGGLIVSCQALDKEPLHSPYIMAKMAYAAAEGGAVGIRSNSPVDIKAIKAEVKLPVIGLYKVDYADSDIYITPTMEEVDALIDSGADIIAMDATGRKRPDGSDIGEFFAKVRDKYPQMLYMADCATYKEGINADKIGFDLVGTTLCGYTADTAGIELPCFQMMQNLAKNLTVPMIAEGGIWTPEQLNHTFQCGAYAAVIGTAITRPREITKRFVSMLS